MAPETAQAVRQVIDGLLPSLDATGFHITRFSLSPESGRLLFGCNGSVEHIPDDLVAAIASVTRVDVDFVHGSAIAIALALREYLDSLGPRRPTVTIEELVAGRDC